MKTSKFNRNESDYWLPKNVILKDTLNQPNYRKTHKLLFEDTVHGEFIATFAALQSAKASTHPSAVAERRAKTSLERHGTINAGASKVSREKASNTMLTKYNARHALQNPFFLQKSKDTLMKNHGVNHPMQSEKLKQRQKDVLFSKHGVTNPGLKSEFVEKAKRTSLIKYGTDNPSKCASIKEKILKIQIENKTTGSSKGELELKSYIESLGFSTKKGYIGGKDPKEIDIKIENKDIAFEFNGAYWHSEVNLKMTNRYHLNKTNLCKEVGLRLIHIFDFEWQNRKNQLKSLIRSILGKNDNKVYARHCEVREVDKKEAKLFLESTHLLGSCNFKVAYGLYYDSSLLCMITIGVHHRNSKEIVLNRYVGKTNYSVIGGLSKLCSHAKKIHGPITTWIDLRFSDGENWVKSGWKKINTLSPDYFYIDSKTSKIVSKQSRKKSLIHTPDNMTEHEHALNDKLFRVYDCGKIKLIYK